MSSLFPEWVAAGVQAGTAYTLNLPRQALRGLGGTRTGRRTGSSLDFSDYRAYHPGDDLRTLDWGVYARSDKLAVRCFHEEVTPHVDILIDRSASMDLPETPKARSTVMVAGLLATAAAAAGCTRRVWLLGERAEQMPFGEMDPLQWRAFAFDGRGDPLQAMSSAPPRLRPFGIRVLVSDLLFPAEPDRLLTPVCQHAAQAVLLQLVARDDVEPPPTGRYRLDDVETGERRDLIVDEDTRRRFSGRVSAHRELWREATRRSGAHLAHVTAEELVSTGRIAPLERIGLLARN